MEYRRITTRYIWHFCRNCRNWPTLGYQTRTTPPAIGELCNDCLTKKLQDKCQQVADVAAE